MKEVENTNTQPSLPSLTSIRERQLGRALTSGERIGLALLGMFCSALSIVLLSSETSSAGLAMFAAGTGAVSAACLGRCGADESVEWIAAVPNEACPSCGIQGGSLELYWQCKKDVVSTNILTRTRTVMTTKTAMIRCMNTKQCSFERKYELHMKKLKHEYRKNAFVEQLERSSSKDQASPQDHEESLTLLSGDALIVEDGQRAGGQGAVTSVQDMATELANVTDERDHRQQLRCKKNNRKGKITEHPSSKRLLSVQPELANCPECGDDIKLKRWQLYQQVGGMFDPSILVDSLSYAECRKVKTCGYIATLVRHKKHPKYSNAPAKS